MRSKLFVSVARPELFGNALASAADALSIDLEDAVMESRKGEARAAVSEFLRSNEAQASSKSIIVRVNALATEHFAADVRSIASPKDCATPPRSLHIPESRGCSLGMPTCSAPSVSSDGM